MVSHTASAFYQFEHEDNPVAITSTSEMSALIDAMLTQPSGTSVVALYIDGRPTRFNGTPDHELRIGFQSDHKVGSMSFIQGADAWYAVGNSTQDGPVRYGYMRHEALFPADSLVELDVIRAVAADFLVSGASRLPGGAEWVKWPDEPLEESDSWF